MAVVVSGIDGYGPSSSARLNPNYPNPFSSATRIDFQLAEPRRVRLEVFDLIGRSLVVLVDAFQPAGDHVAHFDGSPLPAGTYWYRLEADGVATSRQMTIARR